MLASVTSVVLEVIARITGFTNCVIRTLGTMRHDNITCSTDRADRPIDIGGVHKKVRGARNANCEVGAFITMIQN